MCYPARPYRRQPPRSETLRSRPCAKFIGPSARDVKRQAATNRAATLQPSAYASAHRWCDTAPPWVCHRTTVGVSLHHRGCVTAPQGVCRCVPADVSLHHRGCVAAPPWVCRCATVGVSLHHPGCVTAPSWVCTCTTVGVSLPHRGCTQTPSAPPLISVTPQARPAPARPSRSRTHALRATIPTFACTARPPRRGCAAPWAATRA